MLSVATVISLLLFVVSRVDVTVVSFCSLTLRYFLWDNASLRGQLSDAAEMPIGKQKRTSQQRRGSFCSVSGSSGVLQHGMFNPRVRTKCWQCVDFVNGNCFYLSRSPTSAVQLEHMSLMPSDSSKSTTLLKAQRNDAGFVDKWIQKKLQPFLESPFGNIHSVSDPRSSVIRPTQLCM